MTNRYTTCIVVSQKGGRDQAHLPGAIRREQAVPLPRVRTDPERAAEARFQFFERGGQAAAYMSMFFRDAGLPTPPTHHSARAGTPKGTAKEKAAADLLSAAAFVLYCIVLFCRVGGYL